MESSTAPRTGILAKAIPYPSFPKDMLNTNALHQIASFSRIVTNYLKMQRLLEQSNESESLQ